MRKGFRYPLAALLGAAVVVLPAVASSETGPTIKAESSAATCGVYYPNCWSPAEVTVAFGNSVALQNSSGVAHGVLWRVGNPATPECSGVPVNASSSSFKGTCVFSQAGTYNFYCYVHGANMSGTVTVTPSGTTTTTTTATSGTTTTAITIGSTPSGGSGPGEPGAGASAGASGSPLAGSASSALRLRATQRGKFIRGSVEVSPSGAGGRLEVKLLARRASLQSAPHAKPVLVGRVVRSSLPTGAVSFAVTLDAKARHALRIHRRLALSVQILLSAPSGSTVTLTRAVVLHP